MKTSIQKEFLCLVFLAVLAVLLFSFKLGSFGLLDPDEPFYSLTAKEMLQSHEYFTPILFGQPQFEKPILFYWVELLSFKFLGVNEFAARLGPCLAGMLTVIFTYLTARVLFKRIEPSFLSAVLLTSAAEFITVSRIVLTDVFLCLFVTASFFCFSLGYRNEKRRTLAWNLLFVFCGLGFLAKGPLGILIPFFGIVPFLIFSGEKELLKKIPWISGLVLFSLIGFPWYVLMTAKYGVGFLKHFFVHENIRRFFYAEHRNWDSIFVYPSALLVGFFPWSAAVLPAFFYSMRQAINNKLPNQKAFLFLCCALLVPLCFFTMAKSKLLSYILPVFPILALMVGGWGWRLYRSRFLIKKITRRLVFSCFIFWVIFPVAIVAAVAVFNQSSNLNLFLPSFVLCVSFVPMSWGSFFYFIKKKFIQTFGLLLAATLFFCSIAFGWILPEASNIFSCRYQVQLFKKIVPEDTGRFLLASKILVRGVSYYTGNQHVGVLIDDPNKAFYTDHPIPIFSTREQLLNIESSKFPVYCFLRQKELRFLNQIAGNPFIVTVLNQNTQSILVRLDRMDKRA